MSEKDMINNGDTPGAPLPGDMPENFEQMLRQLTTQPQDERNDPPTESADIHSRPSADADPLPDAEPSKHAATADRIISAAEEHTDGVSWLDNLLAFAGQNTTSEPQRAADDIITGHTADEAQNDAGAALSPELSVLSIEQSADITVDAADEDITALSGDTALQAEKSPVSPVEIPTVSTDDSVSADIDSAAAIPSTPSAEDEPTPESTLPQWAFDAAPEPEEINGTDWQSAFDISKGSNQPSATAAENEQAVGSTDDSSPTAEETPDAAVDGDATAEFIPAKLDNTSIQPDDLIEDSGYESPKPADKNKKAPKEFRIETDYRRDFGEYDRIHPIKLDKRHKTGCVGGILYFLFIIVVGTLLGGMLWLAAADVLAINKPSNDVEITIPEDFTIDQVADILHSNGLVKYKFLFEIFADFSNAQDKIDPGVYQLKTSYDYRALVSCMSTSSGYRVVTEVTIPEGYNQFQMFELLEEAGVCTQEQLWEAAENGEYDYDFVLSPAEGNKYRLEGYLFPDTYEFYINDDPERVLNKMLSNFNNKFTEEYRLRAEELGYSIHDIIAIAAMIEKETGVDSERATIASVIFNRLSSDDFPYLQIDATIIYATYVTGEEFSTGLDSPYNTYLYEGLPEPITNPGIASIRAALYPETTNYYFYAATTDFTTRFFSRYEDFEAFVESDEFQSSN